MNTFDFSPLYRSTVGFDRLARMLDTAAQVDTGSTYPPYNIERVDDNDYRITMAVAGFSEDELNIEVKENALTVTGAIEKKDEERQFLHRGIAERSFERKFQIADHVKVTGAKLENGLLHIELVREIPEAKKPRQINIVSDTRKKLEAA
ncbi:MAG: Hsp20 family protein [Alphaproteobacteria bacterium]|nr:MAG: Hsp20 family protein [Alphaproteobacteria bacterium]